MKKQVLQFVCLLALLSGALSVKAQRPEAAYVRAGVAGQLKKNTVVGPLVNRRFVSLSNARVAADCPTCQQITFGSFSPNGTYISVYGSDSIWYNTYKYLIQDPIWSGGYLDFTAGCLNFTHYADTSFGAMTYWDGFTVSKTNTFPCDTACGDACNGLQSQFSSITKGGVGGANDPYSVAYYGYNSMFFPENHTTLTLNSPSTICGLYVTNNAYAYKSMKCGDLFAHKFAAGDWFKLTIEGFSGGSSTGTVDYYLADFTGSNAYIVNSWKWVNLTSLGTVDSLAFYLNTSDAGEWGPNTPMYFCIDDIKVGTDPSCGTCAATDNSHSLVSARTSTQKVADDASVAAVNITPNPASTQITVQAKAGSQLEIFDASGNRKYGVKMTTDKQTLSVSNYAAGVYILRVNYNGKIKTQSFIKK